MNKEERLQHENAQLNRQVTDVQQRCATFMVDLMKKGFSSVSISIAFLRVSAHMARAFGEMPKDEFLAGCGDVFDNAEPWPLPGRDN